MRRTGAEPLEASWRPDPTQAPHGTEGKRASKRRARKKSNVSRWVGTYGWRVYALPVLLVLTVIAVFDAQGDGSKSLGAAPAAESSTTNEIEPAPRSPDATENPAEPIDLDIPSARLPGGGAYTKSGKGTWHLVPGKGKVVGEDGKLYRYTVEVEDGIDPSSYGGDDAFATMVEGTLSDPRSWTGDGKVRFQRIGKPEQADFRISLTTPGTNHKPDICGYSIRYESSCYRRSIDRVVINLARWVRGAKAFNADMGTYRQYAINHEVGHALGNGHVGCGRTDSLAPVMMQQSFGVANDYVAKLNGADPTNYGAVPKDGKVCKPNAWPNPAAE